MKTFLIIAIAVMIMGDVSPAAKIAMASTARNQAPTDSQRPDLSAPGREVIQVRVDLSRDMSRQCTHIPRRDHLRH